MTKAGFLANCCMLVMGACGCSSSCQKAYNQDQQIINLKQQGVTLSESPQGAFIAMLAVGAVSEIDDVIVLLRKHNIYCHGVAGHGACALYVDADQFYDAVKITEDNNSRISSQVAVWSPSYGYSAPNR